jgi:hypothetical protein
LAVLLALVLAGSGGGNAVLALSRYAIDGGVVLLWAASAAGLGWVVLRACRWEPGHPAMTLGLSLALGWGLIATGVLMLGWGMGFGPSAGRPWLSWAVLAPGLVAGAWAIRGATTPVSVGDGSWGGWLLVLVAVPLGVVLFLALFPTGLLWPGEPNRYDVLAYHFQLPREWYELGRIETLRHNVFSFMPLAMETHYLLAMGLMGGPWAGMYSAQLMHVAVFVAAGMIAYGCFRPQGMLPAGVATAAVLACPHVLLLAPIGYNEGALVLYGMAVLALLFPPAGAGPGGVGRVVLAGMCAGFGIGSKLTMLPMYVVVPAAAVVCVGAGDGRGVLRRAMLAGVLVVVALLAASPWGIRTAAATGGNPVFPLATQVLPAGHFTPEQVERFDRAHAPRPDQQSVYGRTTAFVQQVLLASEFGYVLVPGSVLAGLLTWRSPVSRGLLLILLGQTAVWLWATHLQSRFFVASLPVMVMLWGNAIAIAATSPRGRLAGRAGLGVLMAAGVFGVGLVAHRLEFIRSPQGDYQTQFVGMDMAAMLPLFFSDSPEVLRIDPTSRLTLVGDARAYLYPHPMARLKYTSVFDAVGDDVQQAWRANDPSEYRLVSPSELQRFGRTYAHIPPLPPEWAGRGGGGTFLLRPGEDR